MALLQAIADNREEFQHHSLDLIKSGMKATWEDGDYAEFSRFMEPGAIQILEEWNISPDQRFLDVGCGSGQTAIPAARAGQRVTGIDVAENLIAHARVRARQEGLEARFDAGDAEDLPYKDSSFDVAISLIGAMFAPRPDLVAAEFGRVIRPGGRLYMANWTSSGMPAQMFKCLAGYVPPVPGVVSPILWGDEDTVRARLDSKFGDIQFARKFYPQWHFDGSASDLVGFFRAHFGPVKRAFEAADFGSREVLHDQLERIYADNGEYENGRLAITGGEYLEVIARRSRAQ